MKLNNIQGLRFLAFTLVFMNHAWALVSTGKVFDYGARGVEIFFILSGYLISYNYSGRANIAYSWKDCILYTKNKIKRFYFLHILTFFMAVYVIGTTFTDTFQYFRDMFLTLTMLKSWYNPAKFSFNGATWFLSTMIFCWFFVPKIVQFFKDKSSSKLFLSFLLLFLIKMIVDSLFIKGGIKLPHAISLYVFPPYRFIDFLLGYVAYLLLKELYLENLNHKFLSLLQISFSILLIFVYIKLDKVFLYHQFILLEVFFIHLVLLQGGIFDKLLGNFLFVHLGNISFELYILHGELLAITKQWLLPLGFSKLSIFFIVILITWCLSELFYSKPVRRFITDSIWHIRL
ncbi:acyltransferase family protein [Actinobacillus equuli]|uniref:acyltransferase family protein n=1 Tax=Actinobacillus equuli TaxID=718 RepID=UPI002441AEA9|nr:acyltransferase family protein [Actinobacillus equuli]WGE65252.1 acyltransferase family protein [Actinobacillus equuli subsp. equuli]WGE79234.1 acyltransferase family protein [Actinobacillus equuli subsp. equuli]